MASGPRKISPLLAAAALLALGLGVLFVLRGDKRGPEPNPLLSDLGEKPDWPQLSRYDGVLTRARFEKALREVYTLEGDWPCTIDDQKVVIDSALQPEGQVIRFARPGSEQSPPRYWRPAGDLPPAAPGQPLSGLRIAIDPGHLGGDYARMEERWYRIGESAPVTEGDMALRTAHLLRPRLEALGAVVTLVRETSEPVTTTRPRHYRRYAARKMPGAPAKEQQELAERLFYRTAEIRARARLVNEKIKPDLILCLHYNAEAWGGDPANPEFTAINHFHIILHGAYMPGEIAHEDERFEMLHKIFQGTHEEETAIARELVKTFAKETRLPAYLYRVDAPAIQIGPALWARNLLANRLYNCPVLFLEPYVMNSETVFERVQAGDYEGEREVDGKMRRSLYREYVDAVVGGLVNYYAPRRKSVQ